MDVLVSGLKDLTLTIPVPSYIPRARGIHAVGKFGSLLKAKCTPREKELTQLAAEHLGISHAEFIRWCATYCAKEVLHGFVPDA
jgi:hypothetical protein